MERRARRNSNLQAGRGLVIGLGSGRCGTVSLAKLLSQQRGVEVSHERLEYNLAAAGSEELVLTFLRQLTEGRGVRPGARCVGDVFSAYLYYVEVIAEALPEARFVCLRRDRAATVTSFVKKVHPANHWMAHDGVKWMSDPWDRCFPNFAADSIEDAVGAYWDDYYSRAADFMGRMPERFGIFELHELNDPSGQSRILDFAGLQGPFRLGDVWSNRGAS